jgi:hypothetical protein
MAKGRELPTRSANPDTVKGVAKPSRTLKNVMKKVLDGLNVALSFVLIAFIAVSLFRLASFYLQGSP